MLPQFHVGGWNVQALLAWWKGATVVLERQFDPARAAADRGEARHDDDGRAGDLPLPGAAPGFADADLSSLRAAVVGGAPMPEALLETWAERGIAIVQGYGLTEAAPNVLCLPPEDAVRKLGYAGKPYPFVDVRLSRRGRAAGARPERLPRLLAQRGGDGEAFTDDGWLRTGDVADRDDEGFYRIKGRLKDMYISGGENVYPAEVEAVLHEHPQVADAAVVGMPDERWGEVGVAFVVRRRRLRRGAAAKCRGRLARFKVPKSFRFVGEIPRNGDGQGAEARAARDRGRGVSDVVTGVAGRALSRAAWRRAGVCSRRRRRYSQSSATTRRRS